MSTGSKRVRDSSIELLRIAAMFCIVICHFATHGKFEFDTNTVTVPRLWWYFIEMGGNFGVNVFVLVSGYFLINARGELFNLRRILKFWGQVFFYSVSIYFAFRLFGIGELTSKPVTDILFPITFRQWWFASTYFVLYLLHPFINRLLRNLSKEEFQRFLILLMMMFRNLKIGYHKWINLIASATFGVYLIHDNPIVRPFLWQTVFRNASYQETSLIVPYSIGAACLVYAVCTVIDLLRQVTVEKAFMTVVGNRAESIAKPFRWMLDNFKRFAFGEQGE